MFGWGSKKDAGPKVAPGNTFFGEMKHNFDTVNVTSDGRVPTMSFLDAADAFDDMFLLAKAVPLTLVYNDMHGNIEALRKMFLANPLTSEYLDAMVEEEEKQKPSSPEVHNKIFYLFMGLDYGSQAIATLMNNPQMSMTDAFDDAYGRTLYRWHSSAEAGAYKTVRWLIPTREKFVPTLGDDQKKAAQDALAWKAGLDKVIEALRPLVEGKIAAYLKKTPAPPKS